MKIHSIDRASTIASRAVASSSTNDERFPIPDSQSINQIRVTRRRARAFSSSTEGGAG